MTLTLLQANWFVIFIAVLHLGAGIYEGWRSSWIMAGVYFCFAVSDFLLSFK